MQPTIRCFEERDRDAVLGLSLRAWAPVFASLEAQLHGSGVFGRLYPDWRTVQRDAVHGALTADDTRVRVAETDATVAGFVALRLHPDAGIGEIHMVAVDPEYQRRGIGSALSTRALDAIQAAGMAVAMVETGGDPGHAPARRTYERAGFTALPITRYFRTL